MFKRAVSLDHDTNRQVWEVRIKRYFFWIPITIKRFEYLTLNLALAKWNEL